MVKTYVNEFNTATITEMEILPYKGATSRKKSYMLRVSSNWGDFLEFHKSMYDCFDDALSHMRNFGGMISEFKEVQA